MSTAEHSRRYRQRDRAGVRIVYYELANDELAEMLERGWISDEDSTNLEIVARAMKSGLRDLLGLRAPNFVTRVGRKLVSGATNRSDETED